ncbi:hypothetical protein [Kitasatospora sp. NPDC093102]
MADVTTHPHALGFGIRSAAAVTAVTAFLTTAACGTEFVRVAR